MPNLMKKFLLLTFAILTFAVSATAETRHERDSLRHEVRIGWGDQMFESLMWQVTTPVAIYPETSFLDPADVRQHRDEKYRYHQHWFAEYQYRFNRWFGLGFLFDCSGVSWETVTRDGYGMVLDHSSRKYFYNIAMMPNARFTFYNHEYVSLYAALGLGLDINSGTEKNIFGKTTDCGFVANATLFAVAVNYQRFFLNFEYGGMYALKNGNTVFMLKSRMFAVSFGVTL